MKKVTFSPSLRSVTFYETFPTLFHSWNKNISFSWPLFEGILSNSFDVLLQFLVLLVVHIEKNLVGNIIGSSSFLYQIQFFPQNSNRESIHESRILGTFLTYSIPQTQKIRGASPEPRLNLLGTAAKTLNSCLFHRKWVIISSDFLFYCFTGCTYWIPSWEHY